MTTTAQPELKPCKKLSVRVHDAIAPGPFCRDCADEGGRCPYDGELCDPAEKAKEIAGLVEELERRATGPELKPRHKTVIEVLHQEGDPEFIRAVYGAITSEAILQIESDFDADPPEWPNGDGIYSYEIAWDPPQIGDEGRVEIPGYWDLTQVGFKTFEEDEEDENRRATEPAETAPTIPTPDGPYCPDCYHPQVGPTDLDRAWAWFRSMEQAEICAADYGAGSPESPKTGWLIYDLEPGKYLTPEEGTDGAAHIYPTKSAAVLAAWRAAMGKEGQQ